MLNLTINQYKVIKKNVNAVICTDVGNSIKWLLHNLKNQMYFQ